MMYPSLECRAMLCFLYTLCSLFIISLMYGSTTCLLMGVALLSRSLFITLLLSFLVHFFCPSLRNKFGYRHLLRSMTVIFVYGWEFHITLMWMCRFWRCDLTDLFTVNCCFGTWIVMNTLLQFTYKYNCMIDRLELNKPYQIFLPGLHCSWHYMPEYRVDSVLAIAPSLWRAVYKK